MAITNESKPSTSLTNETKINIGETWASITTTWASETRTWGDLTSLIDNQAKESFVSLWSQYVFPWTLDLPWQTTGSMTNQSKPV